MEAIIGLIILFFILWLLSKSPSGCAWLIAIFIVWLILKYIFDFLSKPFVLPTILIVLFVSLFIYVMYHHFIKYNLDFDKKTLYNNTNVTKSNIVVPLKEVIIEKPLTVLKQESYEDKILKEINQINLHNDSLKIQINNIRNDLEKIERQQNRTNNISLDTIKLIKETKGILNVKLNSYSKIINANEALITYLNDKHEEYKLLNILKDVNKEHKIEELNAEIDKFTYLNVKSELMEEYTYNDAMIELVAKIEATQDNEELNRLVGELNGILREFNSRG